MADIEAILEVIKSSYLPYPGSRKGHHSPVLITQQLRVQKKSPAYAGLFYFPM
jgi:hypothetical protein